MSKNDENPAGGFEAGNGAAGADNPALEGLKGQIRGLNRRQQHKLVWRHNRPLALQAFGHGPPTQTPDPTIDGLDPQVEAMTPSDRGNLLRWVAAGAS